MSANNSVPIMSQTVALRYFVPADAPKVFEMSQEPGVRTWLPDQVYESEVRALAREHDVPLWTLGTVGGDLLEVAPVLGTPVIALAEAHAHGLGRALGRDV